MDAGSRKKGLAVMVLAIIAWTYSSTPRNCILPARKLPIRDSSFLDKSGCIQNIGGNLGTQVDLSKDRPLEVLDRTGRRHEVGETRPTCAAGSGRTADGAGRHPKRILGTRA